MTKTFTEKGIEYLLVEVPKDAYNFSNVMQSWQIDYYDKLEIISLLKDITEEQAEGIVDKIGACYLGY